MTTRQTTRRAEEQLAELAGDTRAKPDRAVRWRELPAEVRRIAESIMSEGVKKAAGALPRVAAFRYGDEAPGLKFWRLGKSDYPPPGGTAGAALYMSRTDSRLGTWIASVISGGRGNNAPRLFTSSTSGEPDDWSRWFEIPSMAVLLRPVRFEGGYPAGGVMEVIENANGRAYRFASGMQICVRDDLPDLTRASADTLTVAWTYPAEFMEAAVASLSLPPPGGGYVDVTAVEVGGTYATTGSGAAVTLGARRCYGAPGFAGSATVSGARAFAFGMWGEP